LTTRLLAAAWERSKFAPGDGREIDAMKSWVIAAAILALLLEALALPAQAQMGGKRSRGGGDDTKSEQKKPVVDDKAYKAALERIPEPKEKYDPWGGARPTEPDKQKKK
jgi:hypothetical protein